MQHRGFLLLALIALLALTSAVAKKKGDGGGGQVKPGPAAGFPSSETSEEVSGDPRPELCPLRVVDKVKKGVPGSECAEWIWGPCTPSSKDCGVGFREGTCGAQTQRIRCRVPCNWKKEFGGEVGRRRRAGKGGTVSLNPG